MASNLAASPLPVGQLLPFRQSLLAMIGICLVVVMTAIDQTVVSMALPQIIADLKGFDLYAWVATAYMLASVLVIPLVGRLSDYYGRKPFVAGATLIFTLASVGCGWASSIEMLIAARTLQGIGCGMLLGSAFACVPDLFPHAKVRLRWQILLSSSFGIANALGPSFGGWLTELAGWRSVFFINLPIGLLCLAMVCWHLPWIAPKQTGPVRIDWLGALLLVCLLCCLQLGVESLSSATGLGLGLLLTAGLSLIALIYWEQRCQYPLLPLALFRQRTQACLLGLSLLTGFGMFALLFYSPLLLQGGLELSPQQAGWLITPLVVCITLGSLINGRIITRVANPNRVIQSGFALIALAYLGLSQAGADSGQAILAVSFLLGGLGFGLVMPNLTLFNQEVSARQDLGIATALMQSLRMIGGLLGTALVGSWVNHAYQQGISRQLAELLPQDNRLLSPQILVDTLAQQQWISSQPLAADWLHTGRSVLITAIHQGHWVGLVCVCLGLVILARMPRLSFVHSNHLASQH